ncbi:MAG TPA: HupE/UreJ family protein, partial [Bacteroidia bacterium]|nr:HupE/UreJ family protein [Bacteroidia bacterium]
MQNTFQKDHIRHLILFLVFIGVCLFPTSLQAHTNNSALENLSRTDIFFVYLQLGFTHIIPLGFDHILFILSLFLLSPKLKTIIWQATAFTI